MSNADEQIADTLARYGEPFAGTIWRVQGTAVIAHKALEHIAARAKIPFDIPTVLRAERDEAVILAVGRIEDRTEWSIGEALLNVNYRVPDRQPAYVYATAEERAKDRVILKLIGLHGLVYSEEEADEFKKGRPSTGEGTASEGMSPQARVLAELKRKLDEARTAEAVTDLMTSAETHRSLADLPQELKDQVRDHAKARMVALGWTPKRKAA